VSLASGLMSGKLPALYRTAGGFRRWRGTEIDLVVLEYGCGACQEAFGGKYRTSTSGSP